MSSLKRIGSCEALIRRSSVDWVDPEWGAISRRSRTASGIALAWALAALLATAATAQQREPSERRQAPGPTNRDRSDFEMLREEGFPLNVDPEIVSAKEAPMEDGDMVMGIVHNGEARAYPVNYMNGPMNEVVNDNLGGTAIAPSW